MQNEHKETAITAVPLKDAKMNGLELIYYKDDAEIVKEILEAMAKRSLTVRDAQRILEISKESLLSCTVLHTEYPLSTSTN